MGIKAHYLKDSDGNKFYPYGHADAIFDKNGQKIGTRLDNIENDVKESESIFEYDSSLLFPTTGKSKCLYVDKSADKIYRWNDTDLKYYSLNDYEKIKTIDGCID